jgi:DNA-binding Xre family transcriptional regulator
MDMEHSACHPHHTFQEVFTMLYTQKYVELNCLLLRRNMNHKQLARAAGITPPVLSSCLTGKRSFRLCEVAAICQVLDIPLTDISLYFSDGLTVQGLPS